MTALKKTALRIAYQVKFRPNKAGSVRSARRFDLDMISVVSMGACMMHLAIPYFHSEAMCPLKHSPQFSLGHHAAENLAA